MMIDDDTYVNAPLLFDKIFNEKVETYYRFHPKFHHFQAMNANDYVMRGFLGHGAPIQHPNDTMPYLHKVICPSYLFNGVFPEYLSGAGYILPKVTLPCLYA